MIYAHPKSDGFALELHKGVMADLIGSSTTQHAAWLGQFQRNAVSPTASTAFYVPFGLSLTAQTTEANVQTTLRIGCSILTSM